ncbi:response regulator [Anoxynatronum sibiricum]|uniref:Stage 0 sporulation protein A homolog n=1 Tax=Anoxynatronum sibiricum TaxID=210623 RepID=A0ABU9VVD7_9CLOT
MGKETTTTLYQKIRKILESHLPAGELTVQVVEKLVDEVSTYHQELEHQNQQLVKQEDSLRKLIDECIEDAHTFQNLFEEAPVAYMVLNETFEIKQINSQGRMLVELPDQPLKGQQFLRLLTQESQNELEHYLREVEDGQEPSPIFVKMQTKTGRRWIRLEAVKTKIHHEEQWRLALFDDTEEVENKEKLKQTLHQYQHQMKLLAALVEHSDSIAVVKDLNLRVMATNTAFAQIAGYEKPEDLLGKTDAEIFGISPNIEPIRSYMEDEQQVQQLNPGEYLIKEELVFTNSGEKKTVLTKKFPIYDETGKLQGTGNISLDITDRKQLEEDLAQYTSILEQNNEALKLAANKAEAATQAKSQFLANMSHEIRTPMNGILGFLQLLEETQLSRQQIQYIAYIKTSTETLLTLINDILDFSKIESGKMELENIPFDLRSAVEDAVMGQAHRGQSKGLEMNLQLHPGLPHQVKGDPTRFRQILTNLISNAVKFTEKGHVTIACHEIEKAENYSTVEIAITDTGIGIPQEALETLFQTFTQVDASTTREYGGSGLGLAITRDLVKLMGGNISVNSTLGQGSTFIVTLPLPMDDTPVQTLTDHQVLKGKHIHIVDDVALNREILRSYLEEAGCQVTESTRGVDVIDRLIKQARRNEPVHAVVMDQQMPGMSGDDLAAALKVISDTKEIPLCLVTSAGQYGKASHATKMGFDAYLTKPMRRRDLLDTIASLVIKDTQLDEAVPLITRHTLREAHHRQKIRVLVAEDHAVNRDLMVQLLRNRGMRCDVVQNGQEALQACQQEIYDLILMDVQMPVMDGLEATRQIRNLKLAQQPKIVAMTAHAMKEDEVRCLKAGMDAYMSKPINIEQVNSLLQEGIVHYDDRLKQDLTETEGIQISMRTEMLKQMVQQIGFDEETAESLLTKAVEDWHKLIDDTAAAAEQGRFEEATKSMHKLIGSAANLRAKALAQLAIKAEVQTAAEDKESLRKTLAKIQTMLQQIESDKN